MNMQREVVYTWRNEVIDSEEPRTHIYEVIDEAVPAKVKEYFNGDEPNYTGLIHWVNTTFPLGLTKEKAQFETRSAEENTQFLIEKIKNAYESRSNLQAFGNVLATLRQSVLREEGPTAPTATADARIRQPVGAMAAVGADGDGDGAGGVSIDLPIRRSLPKVGRNEPCPCGSGK